MSNLLRKPNQPQNLNTVGLYERFNLSENPFPSEPVVNKESTDKRINGDIYEIQIREKEFDLVRKHFLIQPQNNPNHFRLGYIIDTSYIGRGNGKSAFLINLLHAINKEYCLDLTNEQNKCFGVYVSPEPGGRTKTFPSFVDCIFDALLKSNIISVCLATLRLEAISNLYPEFSLENMSEAHIVENLNEQKWFSDNNLSEREIDDLAFSNKDLQNFPPDFPFFSYRSGLFPTFVNQRNFEDYYKTSLKKAKEKIDFVFSHLVKLFIAANFNGAYVLVDDFERIPDFQSARQKRDFALELRLCLFDGFYLNSKIGFYNFFLVLHAGVPRLISDAWSESGMENRAPINQSTYKNIIPFEKLNKEHALLLIKKYLSEYRIDSSKSDDLYPFTQDAVTKIGELSEFNAAKILRMAYELLDKAVTSSSQQKIDEAFIGENREIWDSEIKDQPHSIETAQTTNLLGKAEGKE